MSHCDFDSVVVGAGVVGLACAARLAESGREVLVLERNLGIGEEVSSRNSEVIHAGIYYPPGSLKARLCVEGKKALYQHCEQYGVPYHRTGKLIVAVEDGEVEDLNQLLDRARANGVDDVCWLTESEAKEMEPALHCVGALYSPSTGIIDSHALMLSLQGVLESRGGSICFAATVKEFRPGENGITLDVVDQDGHSQITASEVINCAGLNAVHLATQTQGVSPDLWPEAKFSKGNYFRLKGPSPFKRLIYPAPVPGGLGTHLVLDINGNARFGPDVEPAGNAQVSLEVDAHRATEFYRSVRRYWPQLGDGALEPDYAGIRPKLELEGSYATDFRLLSSDYHQVSGLVHCLGIESPGLTSSLAIADEVLSLLS